MTATSFTWPRKEAMKPLDNYIKKLPAAECTAIADGAR